jgi:hypothetical protein
LRSGCKLTRFDITLVWVRVCVAISLDDCAGREILCIRGLCSKPLRLGDECETYMQCEDSNPCELEDKNGKAVKKVCREYTTLGNKCESYSDCQDVTCSGGDVNVCIRPSKEGMSCINGSCDGKLACCQPDFALSIKCPNIGVCTYIAPEKPITTTTATKTPSTGNVTSEAKTATNGGANGKQRRGLSQEVIGSLIGGGFALLATILGVILTRRRWIKRGAAASKSAHDSGHD